VKRRAFFSLLSLGALSLPLCATPAQAFLFDTEEEREERRRRRARKARQREQARKKEARKAAARPKIDYKGREIVTFRSAEKPGTIIVKTRERALYQVMADGKAKRYLVAVGKDGFAWSGVARIGMKRKNPSWTPPAEMIKRTPKYAKWRNGMPGGIPENPLGARALYLFDGGGDTMYRIHGTNAPSSIGTAASSGCIRMLNQEVVELFNNTPIGTKVIVQ
jgi:lipoprotein-anchoring transpeptidase ErfK/SrfK